MIVFMNHWAVMRTIIYDGDVYTFRSDPGAPTSLGVMWWYSGTGAALHPVSLDRAKKLGGCKP